MIDFHNEEIVRTSIPFRYEPFTEPRLKELTKALSARRRRKRRENGPRTHYQTGGLVVAPMEMGGVAPRRILSAVGRT